MVVVEMEVYDLKLEVGDIVRLVWSCVKGEWYFLWGVECLCWWTPLWYGDAGRFFDEVLLI